MNKAWLTFAASFPSSCYKSIKPWMTHTIWNVLAEGSKPSNCSIQCLALNPKVLLRLFFKILDLNYIILTDGFCLGCVLLHIAHDEKNKNIKMYLLILISKRSINIVVSLSGLFYQNFIQVMWATSGPHCPFCFS